MTNLEFYKEDIKRNLCDFTFNRAIREVLNDDYAIDEYKLLDWLCADHSILDKEEKDYLSAVIKPFRERIYTIQKCKCNRSINYICITLRGIPDYRIELLTLPNFEEDTMYKGMELNTKYTLEELGL